MSNNQHAAKAKRLRFAPLAIATGVLGAVLLSVSMSGTLSGFVASIQNTSNTAASGALTMQETSSATGTAVTCNSTDGGTVSTNAATCATINKYGGSTTMVPGQTVSTAIAIKNTGTVAASTFALAAGTCTQGTNGTLNGTASDLCSQMTVVVTNTTTSTAVFSGTLAAFKTQGSIPLGSAAAGSTTAFTIAVTLPSTLGNTYQGLSVSQPMTWTYNS